MCDCRPQGSIASYQFPFTAINGFQPFEEYHDESLGVDINGRRHREQVMKAMGVREAGDRIHGGRNWDEKAPDTITADQKPTGRSFDDYRREEEKREEDKDNFAVGTVDEGGNLSDYQRAADLPDV
jgi:hypothetical protein